MQYFGLSLRNSETLEAEATCCTTTESDSNC